MSEGIRRIAAEEVDQAMEHIKATAGDAAVKAVHEARKCLKRTRAVLRFGKPLLEPDSYRQAITVIRDVGRAMSGTRDFDVIRLTLTHLKQNEVLKVSTSKRLAELLAEAIAKARHDHITDESRASMIVELEKFRAGLADWEVGENDHSLVTGGIADCLADCRKGFARSFGSADDDDSEAFHDWRKSIQLHWRQMQLVERAWPAYCHARIVEARAISTLIGADRDLGLLLAFVQTQTVAKSVQSEVGRVVQRRQELLRQEAKAMGGRLLAEGKGGFCRRLEGHWAAARALRKAKKEYAAESAVGVRSPNRAKSGT